MFARHEVYDDMNLVCAYELVYQDNESSCDTIDSSELEERATSFVLSHLFTDLDINTVIGSHSAYINFTRNHLLQKIPLLLPKERIIIDVLANTIILDKTLLNTMRSLRKIGYRFSLNNFIFREELMPLARIADVIKINISQLSEYEIKTQLNLLRGFRGKLLAKEIKNREQLQYCKESGFDFFQGFFLNYPYIVQGQVLTENKTYLLKLFGELYHPDVKMERVEEITLQIPTLSYRILRLANSASMYQGKKFESLMEAIQQLGLVQIRNWISLLLVSTLNNVAYDLLERTLIRAKMCQVLARRSGIANPHQAYTVGMLSTLDAILNESMSALLSKIYLSEEFNEALLTHSGVLGYLLAMAYAYEQADFNKLTLSKFTVEEYSDAYLQGIDYANKVMDILY